MFINIDRGSKISLTRQIYDQVRMSILNQELKGGSKLPSTRNISDETGVSRIIIVEAFEQLKAEGYLEGKKGSGTFVTRGLQLKVNQKNSTGEERSIETQREEANIQFYGGIPDLENFPRKLWAKMLRDATYLCPEEYLSYPPTAGLPELRKVMSNYLLRAKGIRCNWDQVFILSGSAQGINLLGNGLCRNHRAVILENPVYSGITRMYRSMNLEIHPIPLDDKGIITEQLPQKSIADFLMVTPSHQHPTGTVLPIQRRIELVKYSRQWNCLIVENDYDSEFRFSGKPISSIQSLDVEQVVHLGTMSESLFPAVRIGYMVAPQSLVPLLSLLMSNLSMAVPSIEQIALSYFIEEGYLERHISKMKKIYKNRRDLFIEQLKDAFGEEIDISGESTGLFFRAGFKERPDLTGLIEKSKELGLTVGHCRGDYIHKAELPDKLILGFGNLKEGKIIQGVSLLHQAFKSSL